MRTRALSTWPTKETDMVLAEKVDEAHHSIWERFFNAENDLLYDFYKPDRSEFPTEQEIAADRPNRAGWSTGIEDGAYFGGPLLYGLTLGAELTGSADLAEKARRVASGLIMLATTSHRRGFLIRGMPPGTSAHYRNSSVDQYTNWLAAMSRYFRSPLSDPEERSAIRQAVAGFCEQIAGAGEAVLTEDGEVAEYCNLGQFRWERSCRLLLLYRVGADVTGDSRWMDLYRQRRDEEGRRRLTDHREAVLVSGNGVGVWALTQNQCAFRTLYELETDSQARRAYRDAMADTARTIAPALQRVHAYDPQLSKEAPPIVWRPLWQAYMEQHPEADTAAPGTARVDYLRYWGRMQPAWDNEQAGVRDPMEAAFAVLFSEDDGLIGEHARLIQQILCCPPYSQLKTDYGAAWAELVYYRGLQKGLWTRG